MHHSSETRHCHTDIRQRTETPHCTNRQKHRIAIPICAIRQKPRLSIPTYASSFLSDPPRRQSMTFFILFFFGAAFDSLNRSVCTGINRLFLPLPWFGCARIPFLLREDGGRGINGIYSSSRRANTVEELNAYGCGWE